MVLLLAFSFGCWVVAVAVADVVVVGHSLCCVQIREEVKKAFWSSMLVLGGVPDFV